MDCWTRGCGRRGQDEDVDNKLDIGGLAEFLKSLIEEILKANKLAEGRRYNFFCSVYRSEKRWKACDCVFSLSMARKKRVIRKPVIELNLEDLPSIQEEIHVEEQDSEGMELFAQAL
ncbi:hypothetical protein G4B88_016229 [Cannabis sativa]|uniref:Uncharacterized protein n=1 Tax=Cannabis sativa TaxID=3483 RepID=A0A7J6FN84_CANSA|nr:hypothetical protein G4B88_016229 [Cannabis sativa]